MTTNDLRELFLDLNVKFDEELKKYTNTNIVLGHDFAGRTIQQIPLEPSGLLGPVTIRKGILE